MLRYDFCEGCGTDEGQISYYSIDRKFYCSKCEDKAKKRNFDLEVKQYMKPFALYP